MKLRLVLAALLTFTFFGLTSAFGQFTPSQDSYTASGAANRGTNYGGAATLNVASARTAFIQFDLSSIPAGYGPSVAKASLKLYVNDVTTAGTFNVVYINGTWSESTITYDLSPALGTQIATSQEVSSSTVGDYINVDVTSAVKAWLENADPNDGLALVANSGLNATFDSKENANQSHPPELDIVFAPVTTGAGSGLQGGAASGTPSLSLIPCTTVGEILSWTAAGWACSPMSLSNEFVPLTGGTMTGTLSVPTLSGSAGGASGPLNITSPQDISVKSNGTMELSAGGTLSISASLITLSNLTTTGFAVLSGPTLVSPIVANSINLQPFGVTTPSTADSSALIFQAASQNSSTSTLANPFFQWQSEPTGANTANPGATMNLLYGPDYNNSTVPLETGLSIAGNGIIHFASGQTFPGGTGGGGGGVTSVTGTSGIISSASTGAVTLSADHGVVAFQTDLATAVSNLQTFATNAAGTAQNNADQYADLVFLPLHGGTMLGGLNVLANGLTAGGNQLVLANNNVGIGTATPGFTLDVAGTVNASNGFNLGGIVFDNGSPSSNNAFLGFAGNGTNPGTGNTASGWQALAADTTGGSNVVSGYNALNSNTSGSFNTALGVYAGQTADSSPMTTNNNTFLGAGSEAANGGISNATAIGSNSVVGASNALVLGSIAGQNNAAFSTNVGIGTPTPKYALDVHGTGSFSALLVNGQPVSSGGGGTVTSVGTGLGLVAKPNPIITSGIVAIDPSVVPQLGGATNTFTGNITAASFTGNGAGLTNVNAAMLNGVSSFNIPSLNVSNTFQGPQTIAGNLAITGIGSTLTVGGPSIFNMDVSPGAAVTSNCLTSAGAGCVGFQFNGIAGNTIFNAQIAGTTEVNVDASGDMTLNGGLTAAGATLPALGTATAATGFASSPLNLIGSAYNGSAAQTVEFAFQTVPQNNGASNASGSLNLMYGQGGTAPSTTGLSIGSNGVITFVPGQTFGSTLGTPPIGVTASGSTATVSLTPCPSGQVLQSNGSGWTCATVSGGGGGGGITETGTITANSLALFSGAASVGSSNVFQSNAGTTNGYIGINQPSPQYALDVNGGINLACCVSLGGTPFVSNYGDQNTFVGAAANMTMTGNGGNTAVGFQTMTANTTGYLNSALGYAALYSNTTGSYNTAVGLRGLGYSTTGNNNTALGTFALSGSLFNGNGNTALGYRAGQNLNGAEANDIYIGNQGTAGESNIIRIGDPTLQTATYLIGNVGVDVPSGSSPAFPLDVRGNANFAQAVTVANLTVTGTCTGCGGSGSGGGTVTSVGSGLGLTGGPITGIGTLSIDTTIVPRLAATNIFTGAQTISNGSLSVTGTPGNITASGTISTTGAVVGGSVSTGGSVGASSYSLTGVGTVLSHGVSSIGGPLVLGFSSGNSTLLSSSNTSATTVLGDLSMASYQSGSFDTAVGNSALLGDTTGSDNTGLGYEALFSNTTGSGNTAIGFEAGMSAARLSTTGNNNTFVGASSGPGTQTTLSNATAIGANALVGESNALVLGGTGSNGVTVGIGTTTPNTSYLLDVEAASSTTNAVNINGNLNVTGALTKSSGTFKIDHPLDPANKYLYHSFVESPDMMNVYNGNINTDDSGLATVTLPDWFEALNRDFRYQLTVIGQFAQAIVASEISHNQFTIRTDKPNVKVSWQVTGIRQDAYANAHRVQVEEDKPPQDQGHYLHPELFGAPPEQAVGYRAPAAQR